MPLFHKACKVQKEAPLSGESVSETIGRGEIRAATTNDLTKSNVNIETRSAPHSLARQ